MVGWLWFLGTLVPVIGIVQVGDQAMADRYDYIPSIGIFVALVFGLAAVAARHRFFTIGASVLAATVLVVFAALTFRQIGFWQNSILYTSTRCGWLRAEICRSNITSRSL